MFFILPFVAEAPADPPQDQGEEMQTGMADAGEPEEEMQLNRLKKDKGPSVSGKYAADTTPGVAFLHDIPLS